MICINRNLVRDFLLLANYNLSVILHHFRDISMKMSESYLFVVFIHPVSFKALASCERCSPVNCL